MVTKNFSLKFKIANDQTIGTATLCPLCKHNNVDCVYGDCACDAVMALDASVEKNETRGISRLTHHISEPCDCAYEYGGCHFTGYCKYRQMSDKGLNGLHLPTCRLKFPNKKTAGNGEKLIKMKHIAIETVEFATYAGVNPEDALNEAFDWFYAHENIDTKFAMLRHLNGVKVTFEREE